MLISILQITNGFAAYQLIFIKKSINRVDYGKVIVEANNKKSKTGFLIHKVELFFAK